MSTKLMNILLFSSFLLACPGENSDTTFLTLETFSSSITNIDSDSSSSSFSTSENVPTTSNSESTSTDSSTEKICNDDQYWSNKMQSCVDIVICDESHVWNEISENCDPLPSVPECPDPNLEWDVELMECVIPTSCDPADGYLWGKCLDNNTCEDGYICQFFMFIGSICTKYCDLDSECPNLGCGDSFCDVDHICKLSCPACMDELFCDKELGQCIYPSLVDDGRI